MAQLAWLVSGAVVTVMVLLVGYFLGLRAAELRADLSPRPVSAPTEVELSWPADVRVTVNDKQVAGSSPLRLPLSRDARIDMSATHPDGPTVRIDVAEGAIRAVDLRAGAPAADAQEGDR